MGWDSGGFIIKFVFAPLDTLKRTGECAALTRSHLPMECDPQVPESLEVSALPLTENTTVLVVGREHSSALYGCWLPDALHRTSPSGEDGVRAANTD